MEKTREPSERQDTASVPTIRPARRRDIPEIIRLFVEFHEFQCRGVPDRLVSLSDITAIDIVRLGEISHSMEALVSNPDGALLVAEQDGQPVGYAEVYERKTEPHPLRQMHRYAYIQGMTVLSPYRRKGVGSALIEGVRQWARERGIDEIQLEAWEFPGGPVEFYDQAGFQTLRRTLLLKV